MTDRDLPGGTPSFATTHWSIVLAAGEGGSPEADRALEALCSTYWFPLYAFVRRQGLDAHAAADLTQSLFARLIERDDFSDLDRSRGRFRAFLIACMRNFLANHRDRDRAQKRGAGRTPLPLDFEGAERRYLLEPSHDLTPERLYHRQWATVLLDTVLTALREEYTGRGKAELFDALKPSLAGQAELPLREIGETLGMSEGAVKVAVHRLRRRYGDALRAEIARTVESPEEIDEELEYLFEAVK